MIENSFTAYHVERRKSLRVPLRSDLNASEITFFVKDASFPPTLIWPEKNASRAALNAEEHPTAAGTEHILEILLIENTDSCLAAPDKIKIQPPQRVADLPYLAPAAAPELIGEIYAIHPMVRYEVFYFVQKLFQRPLAVGAAVELLVIAEYATERTSLGRIQIQHASAAVGGLEVFFNINKAPIRFRQSGKIEKRPFGGKPRFASVSAQRKPRNGKKIGRSGSICVREIEPGFLPLADGHGVDTVVVQYGLRPRGCGRPAPDHRQSRFLKNPGTKSASSSIL